jgi:hypothetical protein
VQFTDDPAWAAAVEAAEGVDVGDVSLRVIRVEDLLRQKLGAGADPARRRAKRLQDLADAQALLEQQPDLAPSLSDEERGGSTVCRSDRQSPRSAVIGSARAARHAGTQAATRAMAASSSVAAR